jgi:hypothetical protein
VSAHPRLRAPSLCSRTYSHIFRCCLTAIVKKPASHAQNGSTPSVVDIPPYSLRNRKLLGIHWLTRQQDYSHGSMRNSCNGRTSTNGMTTRVRLIFRFFCTRLEFNLYFYFPSPYLGVDILFLPCWTCRLPPDILRSNPGGWGHRV